VRDVRVGQELARLDQSAELGRSQPGVPFERLAELTLVRESCIERHMDEGSARGRELPTSEVNPQPSHVLADRAAVLSPEGAGKM
jgi:hypothetical protein